MQVGKVTTQRESHFPMRQGATQRIEKDIINTVKEMIEALKKAPQQLEGREKSNGREHARRTTFDAGWSYPASRRC
jgi:hypothetical protein